MKIDNFKLIETKGDSCLNKTFRATVDVETGFWLWKKKRTVEIFREYAKHWHFVETGEYTPRIVVENLARSYKARTGENV